MESNSTIFQKVCVARLLTCHVTEGVQRYRQKLAILAISRQN